MEVWDVYDKYRNITGKKILKSQVIAFFQLGR